MSGEILKAKNEISMVLRGRKTIAPIFSPFLTLGCGHPSGSIVGSATSSTGRGEAVNAGLEQLGIEAYHRVLLWSEVSSAREATVIPNIGWKYVRTEKKNIFGFKIICDPAERL